MHQKTLDEFSSTEHVYPTCGESGFKNRHGMKIHHARLHGESIAGETVECAECGDEVTVTPRRLERSENNFCSPECHDRFQWDRVEVTCENCAVKFDKKKFFAERCDLDFCSIGCRREFFKQRAEENSGRRIHYHKPWPERREVAKERDFYQCRLCRMTNEEHNERFGQALHVHHRTPAHMAESPHELQNLITVCRPCHHKLESSNHTPQSA
ncbi:HNH endonuclease [Halopelagius fulvigenes]|uniref:HNH endonuclease n=1 Tax=Halopelagius fulvigenes TaxID=1198324 RepID=A0ABD5U1U7_9EURY